MFGQLFSEDNAKLILRESPLPNLPVLYTPQFDDRIFVYEKELAAKGVTGRVKYVLSYMYTYSC